jgi:uncharacterized phiE125 gp8 family phage protein
MSHYDEFTARNRFLKRIADPSVEPVTLAEAKLYLRVDTSNDDTLITDLITSARQMAENWLRRSLITQTWKLSYDDGIPQMVWLPMGIVSSISSVVVFNQDGSSSTIAPTTYWLNAAQNALTMYQRISGFRVEITYVAGYGATSASVPKPIKQGILTHIANLYDCRGEESNAMLPEQTAALYMPYREVRL